MKDNCDEVSVRQFSGGFFINPRIKPTYSDILVVVGCQKINWESVFSLLKVQFRLKVNLKFCTTLEVWVTEFHHAKQLKITLIPDKDNFRLMISSVPERCFDAWEFDEPSQIHALINTHIKIVPNPH